MATQLSIYVPQSTVLYLINHVFFPPKLPQTDDFSAESEALMLKLVLESLHRFRAFVNARHHSMLDTGIHAFENMRMIQNDIFDETKFCDLLEKLHSHDQTIPLHIHAQNAGVMISKASGSVQIESFELSPLNKSVMTTQGRLQRTFPGSVCIINPDELRRPEFRTMMAHTLAKMSHQSASGTTPQVKKAGQMHNEDRDTTSPHLVTELLMAMMCAAGSPSDARRIQKNTREDVLWLNTRSPWRRSASWLFVRVTLQRNFTRTAEVAGNELFKAFMIFFMSRLLKQALEKNIRSDLLYVMTAKISRRLLKMNATPSGLGLEHAQLAVGEAIDKMEKTWQRIRSQSAGSMKLETLRTLDFESDIHDSLPRLVSFLGSVKWMSYGSTTSQFQPQYLLPKCNNLELPRWLLDAPQEYQTLSLAAFEAWVGSNVCQWSDSHKSDMTTCGELGDMIKSYHKVASSVYKDNPEALSVMFLTIMELWIACDKSALASCSLLLEYDPGVPPSLLQSLLLPLKDHMQRLAIIETYLDKRKKSAKYQPADIFRGFGSKDSFSSRYFQQSTEHQNLLKDIELRATQERDQKKQEYTQKKELYDSYIEQSNLRECEFKEVLLPGFPVGRKNTVHDGRCQRCALRNKAKALEIDIHEWPLPTNQLEAQSVIFELTVPQVFGHWRDITLQVLRDILRIEYRQEVKPHHRYSLCQCLPTDFIPFGAHQRVGLVSEAKPHTVTHRRQKSIATAAEKDVCLSNGLRYQYFDNDAGCFVSSITTTSFKLCKLCMYELPPCSSKLQQFMLRPPDMPSGVGPNHVISNLSNCPDHMNLEEYKALCSIPLGTRIQWPNVLSQVYAQMIDFRKLETTLFILQSVYQAGPGGKSVFRQGHEIANDTKFTDNLLQRLRERFKAIQKNWDCSQALSLLISLTKRLLSLTQSESRELLDFLSQMRETAFTWFCSIKNRLHTGISDDSRRSLERKMLEIAMICVDSFNVDDAFLEGIISCPNAASILLQGKITIHERISILKSTPNIFLNILYQRCQQLSYRAYPILAKGIVKGCGSLDLAIKNSWSAYSSSRNWRGLSYWCDNWLINETLARPGGHHLPVHFDLLTGELLVDGNPTSRLPNAYTSHRLYHALFGESILEVMPSQINRMRFSATTCHSGYTLHFNMINIMGKGNEDLLIQAEKEGVSYILIPTRIFEGVLPEAFIYDYVHWYNIAKGQVEFRPAYDPWSAASDHWTLSRTDSKAEWVLERTGSYLIWPKSPSAKTVSSLFRSIQSPSQVHVILRKALARVDIDLPKLQLEFYLTCGGSSVHSKQFRGMIIDEKQAIGTLVGLCNKLILKHQTNDSRTMLIPEQSVEFSPNGDHVAVQIAINLSTRVHAYQEDKLIGRLVDNSSLQSKLFLTYLHALTSFCLVDPLTSRTGTEQALTILNSAAMRSFESLTPENLKMLECIASLTPKREFYPEHEQVMQSVHWLSDISPLAQHGAFHMFVDAISQQAEGSKFFYTDLSLEFPTLDPLRKKLTERDLMRTASFRTPGYGAENHQSKHDARYSSRDRGQASLPSQRAFEIAKLLYSGNQSLIKAVPNPKDVMHKFLLGLNEVRGQESRLDITNLSYDSRYLSASQIYLTHQWAVLHRILSREQHRLSKYHLIAWFATLAYGGSVDMTILQLIAAFYLMPQMGEIFAPSAQSFRLQDGMTVDKAVIQNTVKDFFRPLRLCPEERLQKNHNESTPAFNARQQSTFLSNQQRRYTQFFNAITAGWPLASPDTTSMVEPDHVATYLDVEKATNAVKPKLQIWADNYHFELYLKKIANVIRRCDIRPIQIPQFLSVEPEPKLRDRRRFVSQDDLFKARPPEISFFSELSMTSEHWREAVGERETSRLSTLINQLDSTARSDYETAYLVELRQSLMALKQFPHYYHSASMTAKVKANVIANAEQCEIRATQCFTDIRTAMTTVENNVAFDSALISGTLLPRIHLSFLMSQLSWKRWGQLPRDWQRCLVHYGLSITELQRAHRLLLHRDNSTEFIKELDNVGHVNWHPIDSPDSLLLEIENNMLIRENQEQVAIAMRGGSLTCNAVMQLNMGEGKSSVIVPKEAAAIADGSKLARVIVAKPQSRQMLDMLIAKLGGLLDRRVYHMPFSRALNLDIRAADAISKMCRECLETRGILLVQPEHILSLYLMGIECRIMDRHELGDFLLKTQEFFNKHSRDIVDESDENFSVKFELVYSMGTQQPVEFSPERWRCIQEVLTLVKRFAPAVMEELPLAISIQQKLGRFPLTRILKAEANSSLTTRIASYICETGIIGFPIARRPESFRQAVFRYITEASLTEAEIRAVEADSDGTCWSGVHRETLLLLRGVLAGGILTFALGSKRWRVNFGLDEKRNPPTRLAIPYRAKDSPSARSEFSHPDVVILLTQLSYYYGGLQDRDLFLAFRHLLKADVADLEYQTWVRDSTNLPSNFHQLISINLNDRIQCIEEIFPPMRFAKSVVDYFLNHLVFPKEMREFPQKLSASGWDIGKIKTHLTTGFSGTNDSQKTLPLPVKQLNLPEQTHTNALVLDYLLQEENAVMVLPKPMRSFQSDAESLLRAITCLDYAPRVLLDVGAQILELTNIELAKAWLRLVDGNIGTQAAVYVDDDDELSVVDRQGHVEPLRTSTYSTQLDQCVVFLDEAHTRGTDLRLPHDYRAAVTLGPNLTKDRLTQACMRMRMLGHGQSVIFCVSEENATKIMDISSLQRPSDITVGDILKWSISETWADGRRSMPLWAAQGERFENQNEIWAEACKESIVTLSSEQAKKFLEEESQTLEDRYRPRLATDGYAFVSNTHTKNLQLIQERCMELGGNMPGDVSFFQEQERELAPELEQETQLERPAAAKPAEHCMHPDIRKFADSGSLEQGSEAYFPAFQSLRHTSAARHLNPNQFPKDLLVSKDFSRTIKIHSGSHGLDTYVRPVHWVLTAKSSTESGGVVEKMLVISPHEAQCLVPHLKAAGVVTLHLYATRPNMGIGAIDKLDLYTVPKRPNTPKVPAHLLVQLNLFAGQLYFSTFQEYVQVCNQLGLAWQNAEDGTLVASDGFIIRHGPRSAFPKSTLNESPIKFLKVLMAKIRRDCESIDKTHVGKMLDGILLQPSDFEGFDCFDRS